MRPPPLRSMPLALCVLLAACRSKEAPAVAAADPNTVLLDDAGVSLGGERVGPLPEDKLVVMQALLQKLGERRDKWKETHPTEAFPGALTLELGSNVTCKATMSAFGTAAFAGYPHLTIKQGSTVVELVAAVPRPPDLEPDHGKDGGLVFLSDGNVELRVNNHCGGAYDAVPPASAAAMVKEWCGDKGDCLRRLSLGCEPGMPMSKVLPVLAEVRRGSAKMELGSGGACEPRDGRGGPTSLGGDPLPPAPVLPPGRKAPDVRISEGPATTTGGLTADEVTAVMKDKQEAIKACYVKGLSSNPKLRGRVTLKFEVGKKGGVMTVGAGGSELPDAGVVSCILRVAYTVAGFPAKGAVGTVLYPISLSPK